ncbi:Aste57867_410 [Aphanomyces stellatus]|uniref:Aste57867_410 protein n=1 Tax=Aphanomyces stellatus TaxID=120398 RepID=A0A485K3J3_9STRA|nr:hypothetical protein As57867_000409 [Aphanomyces stellatus]VFT77635.1 Aste57867_410 [Aphanomyces stellatus]
MGRPVAEEDTPSLHRSPIFKFFHQDNMADNAHESGYVVALKIIFYCSMALVALSILGWLIHSWVKKDDARPIAASRFTITTPPSSQIHYNQFQPPHHHHHDHRIIVIPEAVQPRS